MADRAHDGRVGLVEDAQKIIDALERGENPLTPEQAVEVRRRVTEDE